MLYFSDYLLLHACFSSLQLTQIWSIIIQNKEWSDYASFDEGRNFEYTLERKEREKSSITTIKKTKRRLLCAQARSICLFVCLFFSTYYISANTELTRTPFLAHKEIFWILYGFFLFYLNRTWP